MLPLIPYGVMLRKVLGPLPEQELLHAHALAVQLGADATGSTERFWLAQGWQALTATALAVVGHLLLGWSALWILLALAVDLLATLLGDWLKQARAPTAAAAAMASALDTEAALHTIEAMRKPSPWPGGDEWPQPATQERVRAWRFAREAPLRYVYYGTDRHRDLLAATRSVLREVSIFVAVLCGLALMLLAVDPRAVDLWSATVLLAFGSARIIAAARLADAAEADPGRDWPQLLPASLPACAALHLACLLTVAGVQFIAPAFGTETGQWALDHAGAVLITLHLLTSMAQLWLWRRRVQQAHAALAGFARQTPAMLRQRWQRHHVG